MNSDILDENFHANNEIKNLDDIKKALTKAGIHQHFEKKNGTIIVEEGTAIRVTIHFKNGIATVKPNFPKIGNSTQVAISAIFFLVFMFAIPVVFPLVIAILLGQLASYFVYQPKIKAFVARIEQYV